MHCLNKMNNAALANLALSSCIARDCAFFPAGEKKSAVHIHAWTRGMATRRSFDDLRTQVGA
jgi:hypothetical protein